jgi:hypothetical protein
MMRDKFQLPTADSPNQVYGTISSVIGSLGYELGARYHEKLKDSLGDNWFNELQAQREKTYRSMFDPAFVLAEPFYHSTSPTRACLPATQDFYHLMARARQIRNSWAHYNVEPSFASLERDLKTLQQLCQAADLKLVEFIKQVRTRIRDIVERGWVPTNSKENTRELQSEIDRLKNLMEGLKADQLQAQLSAEVQESIDFAILLSEKKRPPIGQEWKGDLGTRKLSLIRPTGDLYDVVAKRSVKSELLPDPETKISSWLAIMPIGGEVYVSDDGAVAAFVHGVMRLIGYMGPEPAVAAHELRGFFTLEDFLVRNGSIESAEFETEPLLIDIMEGFELRALDGAFVRCTTYGDVAYYEEDTDSWIKFAFLAP